MWWNQRENVLESKAQRGFPESRQTFKQRLEEGIIGLAARERKSILARDITANEWSGVYQPAVPSTRSELAVPLMDASGLLGVLDVEHPELNAFNEDDRALLETLAVEAIIAIHSTNLYQRLEQQIKPLRALSTIVTHIRAPRSALDTALRLLLTGVTAGEGLRFSRAMLFLADDEGAKLQGKMAVGAQTKKEAQDTWNRLDQEANNVRTSGENILASLLDQVEAFSVAVAEKRERDYPLSIAIQEMCIPIEEDTGALSVCIRKSETAIVRDDQPDPFREIIERATQSSDRGHAFACTPLIGKGRTIGTLVVDNRFLMNEREIDEGAISPLEAFASVMAMIVENARLQARLEEEQRLETWKEFTASVTHTVGTRVGVIEGWAKILHSSLQREGRTVTGESLENPQVVLEKLQDGIYKAKVVLQELRAFTAPLELRPEELNAGEILKNVIREVQPGLNIPIILTLPEESLTVKGDSNWLSVAFIELTKNAQEAMQRSPVRPPQITITLAIEGGPAGSGTFARIEFIDTGPGVRETDKKRIFEPYFSTKGRGGGLGLANVKRIVEEHKGTIEEIGQYGTGAWFVVRLPTVRSNP
jgi:signal transduction histidine kinase